jgi:hypothetical protein
MTNNSKLELSIILGVALLFVGCSTMKQAHEDYVIGATTPLAPGEVSPQQSAQTIVSTVSAIPVVGGFAPLLGGALAAVATLVRGRKIRKGGATSVSPITGYLGGKVGLEGIVQSIANIATGLFEVGAENSPLKRAWKVGLSVLLSVGTASLAIPAVRDLVVAHPEYALGIGGIAALFGGLEKALSQVLPVTPAKPTES